MRVPKRWIAAVVAAWVAMAPAAQAAAGPSLIRDAEIESIIRGYASPILTAAGIDPASVNIYIVNDDAINAFVAGGLNLFIYAGLLIRAETPNQLIGVIAHETGHMAGGHLIRTREALRAAAAEAILGYILGIGAGIAAKNSGAGAAVIAGSQSIAQANLLQFTRTQENSADHAGLRFLDATHQSARGLVEVLTMLQKNEVLTGAGGNPYLRTHPLTKERLDYIAQYVAQSPIANAVDTPEMIDASKRMRAKLVGFLRPLEDTMRAYPDSDTSFYGRYARSIALFRAGQMDKAVPLIDGLIAEEPDNAYLEELKGQMMFETGRLAESIAPYRESVRLRPDSSLLHLGLGESLVELGDPAMNKEAIRELETAVSIEPNLNQGWRLLSVAYDRDGQAPMTALALAELALGRGDGSAAEKHAERALGMLPQGSPAWLRAEDIVMQAKQDDE